MYLYYNLFIYGRKILESKTDSEKDIIYKWEKYLIHLLFLKEINIELLKKELETNLSEHFKFYCFILGQISYFDIILISIIIDIEIFDIILNTENNENYQYIKRWILSITKMCEIDIAKIKSFYKNKEKEYLYNTYKLTSCEELINEVKSKNYEKVESLLLNEHENVESRTSRYYKSLAHLACTNNDKKMLLLLIKYGCKLESLDFENMTPLYDAIYSNNIEFVEFLIKDLKMNINHHEIQNRTPFYWACCTSNIDMIKYIISLPGIDINSLSSMGRSALSKACWNGHFEVAKLLCSQPNIKTINTPDSNKRCPLHNAVWGEFGGREGKKVPIGQGCDSPECAELLIQHGAIIDAKDSEGNTPLMIAGTTNGIRSLKVLLKYNVNLNEVNNNHETALIQSTKYGNYESILTFIDYYKNHLKDKNNIDLNKGDNNGYSAINYAIFYRKVLALKVLIENMNDYGYNCKEKVIELIFLSIQSHSKLCFNYLFRKLVNEYKATDNEYSNIIKMTLIYESTCFNYIYETLQEEKIINLINTSMNKELILYLLILELQIYKKYDIEKGKTNLINMKKNNIKKISEEEREKSYEEILKKKMSTLTDNEIELFEEDFEQKEEERDDCDGALLLENINSIIEKICLVEKDKDEMNINLIIYLIVHNREKEFLLLKEKYCKENIKIIEFNKIDFDKDKYFVFKPEKHKLVKYKLFSNENENNNDNDIWTNTINYINETNLLFIIIEKSNNIYFKELINNKYLYNYIYDIVPSTKKNILHILFENFDKSKYEKIISIVEETYKDNKDIIKDKFLPMINQSDAGLITPLDVIINAYGFWIIFLLIVIGIYQH